MRCVDDLWHEKLLSFALSRKCPLLAVTIGQRSKMRVVCCHAWWMVAFMTVEDSQFHIYNLKLSRQ